MENCTTDNGSEVFDSLNRYKHPRVGCEVDEGSVLCHQQEGALDSANRITEERSFEELVSYNYFIQLDTLIKGSEAEQLAVM